MCGVADGSLAPGMMCGVADGCLAAGMGLTLSPAAADLTEQCAMAQAIESLLANQLQELRLQTLLQFTDRQDKTTQHNTHSVIKDTQPVSLPTICSLF